MKARDLFLKGLLLILCLWIPHEGKAATIGVAIDGPWERNEEILSLFRREILDLTEGEFGVRIPAEKVRVADWTLPGVKQAVDALLEDPQVDMVLTLGVLVSHEAAHRSRLPKPVVAPVTVDREVQDFPLKGESSGVKNLVYVASASPTQRDLRVFHQMVPFEHLVVMSNRAFREGIPKGRQALEQYARQLGIEVDFVTVSDSASTALAALPAETDAVYLTPLMQLPTSEFDALVNGLIGRGLPTFSLFGKSEVRRGVLAGVAPETDFPRLARRTALNIQSILLGADAASLPVAFPQEERLVINMETARRIGFYPRWDILTEAELLHEEPTSEVPQLHLLDAVHRALTANRDLASFERQVRAGAQQVRRARAPLKPQLAASLTGRQIDGDRAEASFGSAPEQEVSGRLTLTQLVYSEGARANVDIQEHGQRGREEAFGRLRLDIAQQTATAYLDVLRAKTLYRIQQDNLQLTRSNLELARVRREVGMSGPAEVYRWESQIATDQQAVIEADASKTLARIRLNRVLHYPVQRLFDLQETGVEDESLIGIPAQMFRYVENPWSFRLFGDFLVNQGLARSPELHQLDAAIAAQTRSITAARRAFWAPDVALQAEVSEVLEKGGEGQSSSLPGGALEGPDDTSWSVGVKLSLPLMTGGERSAKLAEAREEKARLLEERSAAAERIEQRIRSALEITRASFTGIRLSRRAADAAKKNLGLVTDAYSRGVVSILDLLDAQNASLVAGQVAANAVYDFLIDMMEVQRAIGNLDLFLAPAEQQEEWMKKLETFLSDQGYRRGEEVQGRRTPFGARRGNG